MNKDAAADRSVEEPMIRDLLVVANDKCDVTESGLVGAATRHFDGARRRINPENPPGRSYRLGDEHRDIAGAGAEVEHAHTRLDAAFLDKPPGQSFEAASLQLKAFELGIGMAEQIFVCGNHRASHR